MAYGTISVGDTATLIVSGNTARQSIMLSNTDGTLTVYIGPDNSVTTANGIPIYGYQTVDMIKHLAGHYKGDIYGIVSAGTADVRYWEVTS